MTYENLLHMLRETGIPFAYDHFAEGESPEPPFICFLLPASDNFSADGEVYHKITEVRVELYSDEKNPDRENTVETIFNNHDIYYDKSEVWIADERLYEVMYSFEVSMDPRSTQTNVIVVGDIDMNGPEGPETEDNDAEQG